MTTFYDVLGVADDASIDDIKRAYYERARRYHPDAHMASSVAVRTEAERSMQALNAAWTVLRDPATRRRYDRTLNRRRDDGHAPPERGAPRRPTRRNGTAAHQAGAPSGGTSGATTTAGHRQHPGSKPRSPRPAPLQIAAGFQYWLGGSVGSRRGALNLRALGPSLAALRPLAPDGLVGLHAEGVPVTDRELEHLSSMRGLRFLDLSGTRVTDAGLVHLLGCPQLEWLLLWDTAVSDAGLAVLGRLRGLCHLGLGNTAVSDAGLRHLGELGHLRLLQLWGTDVQGPGLAALHGLPSLETVTLPWRVRGRHRRRLRTSLGPGATVV